MKEPFDIELGGVIYSVFPEEDDTYVIFKEGKEYMTIQKDIGGPWLKLDDETDLPLFDENEEVSQLGKLIQRYTA